MKVFLAGTSFHSAYGGPAYSVSRLAVALADAGLEVGLWAPDQSAVETPLVSVDSGVRRLAGSADDALDAFGIPDIIHDSGIWLQHNHRIATLASSRRIPRVVSTRGMLEPWAMNHKRARKRIAWKVYQRRDLASASVHHATSEAEAANVRMLGLGVPVRVVANGIDIPRIAVNATDSMPRNSKSRMRTALFLGRIYPVKGLPVLVEAWGRERPSGWRLQIAGPDEGGHRAVVERAVANAGLSSVVEFAGSLHGTAKDEAFAAAELFVLPTLSESFGISVAEALAHGLPVLTTTAAPWPLLEETGCGWRTAPTVDGVAGGLKQALLCDAATLRRMGKTGRDLVASKYSWDGVARELRSVYEDLA